MRAWPLLGLLLVLPALGGCLDDGGSTDVPYATFVCKDGLRAGPDALAGLDRCNHRVTKPMLDPSTFDVVTQHGPANEVSIAAHPDKPLLVAGGAKDYTVTYLSDDARCGQYTVWMGTFASADGGITWSNDLMPGFQGDTRESPLHGQWCNTDPVLQWDDDGTLWFNALNYHGARGEGSLGADNPLYSSEHDTFTGSQLYFARSDDGGATFHNFSFVATGDAESRFHDKQWFAVQPEGDHMILTWTMFTGTPTPTLPVPGDVNEVLSYGNGIVMFSESHDAGATWSEPVAFTSGTALSHGVQFSTPAYLPGGDGVAVTWVEFERQDTYDDVGIQDEVVLAYTEGTITPAGTVFAPAQEAFRFHPVKAMPDRNGNGPSTFRMGSYAVLAIDRSGGEFDGRRYVVYPDQPGPIDTDIDLLLRHSDGGDWSEPIRINDVPDGDQWMPWIDIDPMGGVHVMWMDRRHDETNRLIDIYYAYSDDGGASFYPNLRITERSFDGDLGHHQSGAPFIGDYNGLDATEHAVYLLWADTRHTGEPGREKGSDVYAATIVRDAAAGAVFR